MAVNRTYLTFSFKASVTWEEMDSPHFSYKILAKDLEWPMDQMLTLEPICLLGQVLEGDWPRYLLLDQLTMATVHFVQDVWSRGYYVDETGKKREKKLFSEESRGALEVAPCS